MEASNAADNGLDQVSINTIHTLAIDAIQMHTFGASAPLKELLDKFGFTPERVGEAGRELLEGREYE